MPKTTPHLKLVSETDMPDSFKLERRREPRHRLYAQVTGLARPQLSPADPPEAGQICALELLDQSHSGLGAWSATPVPLGATMTIFFPAHGSEPGFDMAGQVVRCIPQETGYIVGMEVHSQKAAA